MLKLFFSNFIVFLHKQNNNNIRQIWHQYENRLSFHNTSVKSKGCNPVWIKYILFFYDNFSVILELDIHKQTKKDYS